MYIAIVICLAILGADTQSNILQVEDVIYGENFPLAVRLHLAAWIEEKFSPLLPFNPDEPNHQVELLYLKARSDGLRKTH